MRSHLALLVALFTLSSVLQAQKPRARDLRIDALPVDRMLGVMKKYGRLP